MDTKLFRLAAVLYSDKNYHVSSNSILSKVVDTVFLENNNAAFNQYQISEYSDEHFNIVITPEEILNIIRKGKKDHFVYYSVNDTSEYKIQLSDSRFELLKDKAYKNSIDLSISDYVAYKDCKTEPTIIKSVLYKYLFELLSTNMNGFESLVNQEHAKGPITVDAKNYSEEERELINDFLNWENNQKNKAVFDIACYALEYCLISNHQDNDIEFINGIKNKVFYLDTNIIFRALGINGESRKRLTEIFLKKCINCNEKLVISKYTEKEFKNSIKYHLSQISTFKSGKVYPGIFKMFPRTSSIYEFYQKWRFEKQNDNITIFQAYIESLFERFLKTYKIHIDYDIIFDEKEDKHKKLIRDYQSAIKSYKIDDPFYHGEYPDDDPSYFDAVNVYLIEKRRCPPAGSFIETKFYFISADNKLRTWDFSREFSIPVVMWPSQWLNILIKFVSRTSSDDDFKSFVNFINLRTSAPVISDEKLNVILNGISEITEEPSEQEFIVKSLLRQGIEEIASGKSEFKIYDRSKQFAQSVMDQRLKETEEQVATLKTMMQDLHETVQDAKSEVDDKDEIIRKLTEERDELFEQKKQEDIKKQLRNWRIPAIAWTITWILITGLIYTLAFCFPDWHYNFVYKLLKWADDALNGQSDLITLILFCTPHSLLFVVIPFAYKRIFSKEEKELFLRKYKG